MIPKYYSVLFTLFLLAAAQKQAIKSVLNERMVKEDWASTQKILNSRKVVRLYQDDIKEESMVKILSLNMSSIEELHFERKPLPDDVPNYRYEDVLGPVLTHKIIRALFTSTFFPRLRVLNLRGTSIDDRFFRFLRDFKLTTNIQQLNLQNCLIGHEGFELLSLVHFPALVRLNIRNTLLKEPAAVEAVARMLCEGDDKSCTKAVEELDISATNIERGSFVRLMRQLNNSSLRVLKISELNLFYRSTYKDGFDYSAFTALTRFPNLTELDLHSCFIDDSVAEGFANWQLPFLTKLNLANNHLSDSGLTLWVTIENMPLLVRLNLANNEVSDGTVAHLAEQGFAFTHLTLAHCKLTAAGINNFTTLQTYSMQRLTIGFNMPSKTFNSMVLEGQLANLKGLTVIKNDFFQNIFTSISWNKLRKLEYLKLDNVQGLKQSVQSLINDDSISLIFPNLKYFILENVQLQEIVYFALIALATGIFPNLQQLIIHSNGNIISSLNILSELQFEQGTYLQLNELKAIKKGSKYELISLPYASFIFDESMQDKQDFDSIINQFLPIASNSFYFENIESLTLDKILFIYVYARLFESQEITELPNLRDLVITSNVDAEILLDAFGEIELPSLRKLQIRLIIPADTQTYQIEESILPFLQKFTQISSLMLYVTFLNEETGFLQKKQFMGSLYFPHLRQIEMIEQNMEVEEIEQFIRTHNQTLRSIDLGNNFMEKDFFMILVDSQCTLTALSLDSTSFVVEEFAILGLVRTQFISIIFLSQCDLTNQHIFAMLSQNKTTPFFPKLQFLKLEDNDIRKQGLEAFLKTQLYDLLVLFLDKNRNPDFINLLLTYPTQIKSIEAIQVEIYGMKDNLNPLSARNIQHLEINTRSFIRSDFQNLAKLSFPKLQLTVFEIYNIYDCQVLLDLLTLNQNAEGVHIAIRNDKEGLNSSCLKDYQFQSHMTYFLIQDAYGTTYLPQFVEILATTDSLLKEVGLVNTRLPPSAFKNIFEGYKFGQMINLILYNNYLGDDGCKLLQEIDLSNLNILDLSNNELTDYSIETISKMSLQSLRFLFLNKNKFGRKGMSSLSKMNAKELAILFLSNCQLQSDSLQVIANFSFEKLFMLDLSYNNFDQKDILEFVAKLEDTNLPSLLMINFQGIPLTRAVYDDIKTVLLSKQILFQLDEPSNMRRRNSAHY